MYSQLLTSLYFTGTCLFGLILYALLKKTKHSKNNVILSLICLVFAYQLLEAFLLNSKLYKELPYLIGWNNATPLILGPLFYFYVKSFNTEKNLFLKMLPHLIPWLYFFVQQVLFIPTLSGDQIVHHLDVWLKNEEIIQLPQIIVWKLISSKAHLTVYLLLSIRAIKKLEEDWGNEISDSRIFHLHWQRLLWAGLVLMEATWVLLFLLEQFYGVGALFYAEKFWLLFIAAIVLPFTYLGLTNIDLISSDTTLNQVKASKSLSSASEEQKTDNSKIKPDTTFINQPHEKYSTSKLDQDTLKSLSNEVLRYMQEEQAFLTSGLKLSQLAEYLQISPHILSQVINESFGMNFFQFINQYRVEYAKELLLNPKLQFRIEDIAIEVGFNNRVTFNKAFKESTGVSPSKFKESNSL